MVIIDIRDKREYNEYHYPGSINIPRIQLLSNPEFYLNKNEQYSLICDKGITSKSVSNILNSLGYNTISITGGIENLKNNIK